MRSCSGSESPFMNFERVRQLGRVRLAGLCKGCLHGRPGGGESLAFFREFALLLGICVLVGL